MVKQMWPTRSMWFLILMLISGIILAACGAAEPPSPTSLTTPAPQQETITQAYPAPGYPAPAYPGPEDAPEPEILEQAAPPSFPGKLAFHSEANGPLQIYIMNGSDGLIEQRLQTDTQAFEPNWSPDCQTLAFSSGAGNDDAFKLYTVQSGSDSADFLATEPGVHYWAPAWSPTGDMIAYQNNKDQLFNVCLIGSDGTDLGCLERGDYSNAMPSWSPDGNQLLFTSNRDGDWEVYLTDYPPTGQDVQLTNNEGIDFYPRFSPDGSHIVFSAKRIGNYDIYTMNADGSNEVQLTSDFPDDTTPTWVGDDRIAFSSSRASNEDWELYLMDADGTNLSRLTYQTGTDQYPTWCPSD